MFVLAIPRCQTCGLEKIEDRIWLLFPGFHEAPKPHDLRVHHQQTGGWRRDLCVSGDFFSIFLHEVPEMAIYWDLTTIDGDLLGFNHYI